MRIIPFLGLLVAMALAAAVPPVSAQDGGAFDNVKKKFEDSKRRSEILLKRKDEIIAAIKSSDPKVVEESFNQLIAMAEEVIKGYSEGGDLWKALDELDQNIRFSLDEATKKAATAPAKWGDMVKEWQENKNNAVRQRTELKAKLITTRNDLESLKQDRDLIQSKIRSAGVRGAQKLIDQSLRDFDNLHNEMKAMIETPTKALPGGGT